MVFFLCSLGWVSSSSAVPLPPLPPFTGPVVLQDQAFRAWAQRVAAQGGFEITAWGRIEAERGERGYHVTFRGEKGPHRRHAISPALMVVGDRVWSFTAGLKAREPGPVLHDGPPGFHRSADVSGHVYLPLGGYSEYRWTVEGGRAVEIYWLEGSRYQHTEVDRHRLVRRRHWDRYEGEEPPPPQDYGIIPVMDPPVAAGTPTQVTFGASRWSGPGDADVAVQARPRDQAVELILTVTDDAHVPVRGDRWLAGDHLEIWWCDATPDCRQPLQLGITVPPEAPRAVWLHPENHPAPLPPVRRDGREVRVELPGVHGDGTVAYTRRGTVVFSDVDPESPQQTLVATSALKWGQWRTFGDLEFHPEGWMAQSQYTPWCQGRPEEIVVGLGGFSCLP